MPIKEKGQNATQIANKGVSTTAPTNDQVLTYNSTSGEWEPATPTPGSASFPSIDDQGSSNDDQLTLKDTEVVINEDGDDLDFRVEASGEANALVVQGSDGNVGIGTGSPSETLHIAGDQKNILLQTATNNDDDTNSILFRNSGTSLGWRIGRRYDASVNDSNYSNLVISGGYPSDTDYEELVDRLTIHQDGNVGIGTSAPAKALHVVDSALIKGRATFTLTGSIDVTGTNVNVPGTNTKYLTELNIGDDIVVSGETRTIATITNDTTATVTSAWGSNLANDASPDCNPAAFTLLRDTGAVGLIVDDDGNVGIGTDSPSGIFEISDATSGSGNIVNVLRPNLTNTQSTHVHLGQALSTNNSAALTYTHSSGSAANLGLGFFANGSLFNVNESGNVGIGTDSPASRLHIYENNSNTDATLGLTIEQDGTGDALLQFLLTQQQRWILGIDHSDGDKFKIAETTDLGTDDFFAIDTSGNVEIATGNLKIGTAGKGIDFSAQASPAAGMTAELLDRYEVGTWTPTVSGPSSISYGSQSGLYSRIGSLVTIKFYLSVSFTSGSYFRLEGLPFTCGTVSGDAIAISFQNMESGVAPIFYAVNSTTYCNAYEINALSVAWVPPTASGKYVIGSGSYTVQ